MKDRKRDAVHREPHAGRAFRLSEGPVGMRSLPWGEALAGRVWAVAEPLCDAQGLELVHVECLRAPGGRLLRITLDKPGGVTLEDCAAVSRELGDLLDVSLPGMPAYRLEVSSPGPQRRLSRAGDFERFRGRRARIHLRRPLDGRRTFSGILAGLSPEGAVRLEADGGMRGFPLEAIAKAHLVDPEPSASAGGALRTHRGDAPC